MNDPICRSLLLASVLGAALIACAGRPQAPSSPDEPAPKSSGPGVARAEALLAQDPEAAIKEFEQVVAASPEDTRALKGLGRANLGMARQLIASGGKAFMIEALFEDSARAFAKAEDLDRKDWEAPFFRAEVELTRGGWTAASQAAMEAARRLEGADASGRQQAEVLVRAAEAKTRELVVRRRQEGEEVTEHAVVAANEVTQLLATAISLDRGNDQAYRLGADVHVLVNRPAEALAILERGIFANPRDVARLHVEYQRHYFMAESYVECIGAYRRLIRDQGESPILLEYLGRAQVADADQKREKMNREAAETAYATASGTFERARTLAPEHAEHFNQWIALGHVSRGHMALEAGDLDGASHELRQAFAVTPAVAALDESGADLLRDSLGKTYRGGLFGIGQRLVLRTGAADVERTHAFWVDVTARHDAPGWGAGFNNLGLACRDLGTAIADRDTGRAKRLWEQGYKAYSRAVELSPDEPRIVNDCALMLVYHLERDWDRAEQLFRRAIELGEAELAKLDGETPAETRNDLEEAVGDAWQNLGVMYEKLKAPATKVHEVYAKAVAFYPYQMREAAKRIAAMKGGAEVAAAMIPAAAQDRSNQTLDAGVRAGIEDARRKVAAGSYEDALKVMEKLLRDHPKSAPLLAELGWTSFLFAKDLIAKGGTASLIDGSLADAQRWLAASMEADSGPVQTRLRLLEVMVARGNWKEAALLAGRIPGHLQSQGAHLEDAERIRLLLDTSTANFRTHADLVAAGEKGDERMVTTARASLVEAIELVEKKGAVPESLGMTPGEIYGRLAQLETWLSSTPAAVAALERGALRFPAEQALLGQLIDAAAESKQPALAVASIEKIAKSRSGDAAIEWYLGRALFGQANLAKALGKWDEALPLFAKAGEHFAKAKSLKADFADSSDQWVALAKVGEGFVHYAQKDLEPARAAWLAAVTLRPDKRDAEIDAGQSAKIGIGRLGGGYATTDLAAAEKLFRDAGAAAPDDADWANNHGLFARDQGERLRRQGSREEAALLFEASYAAYKRALSLTPDDARLLNDCALILVYYLDRELDDAEAMLQKAVVVGNRQMEESPPADAESKNLLEEAIGDAHQNLGKLHLEKESKRDPAKAREHLEKSLEFYPKSQRGEAKRMLVQAKRLETRAAPQSKPAGDPGEGK